MPMLTAGLTRAAPPSGCQCRVTLQAFALAIGRMGAGDVAGFFGESDDVGPDWNGEVSVPVAVASRVVAEIRAQAEHSQRLRVLYDADLAERGAEREQLTSKAAEDAHRAWTARYPRPRVDGAITAPPEWLAKGRHVAFEAAAEAAERFDAKRPVPSWQEWLKRNADRDVSGVRT